MSFLLHRGAFQPTWPSRAAFSLIEVMLALGVASFALTSVVGLLFVSMGTDRQAANDTAIAAMSGFVDSTLRTQKFAVATSGTRYFAFDADGRCLAATNAPAYPIGAFFTCTALPNMDVAVTVPSGLATNGAAVFRVRFVWPYPANTSTNESSLPIANYD